MFVVKILSSCFKSTKLKPNQCGFLDLIRPPTGSQIPISKQQKQKIHQLIDQKMQELQNTGLSRQQILLSKYQKGLPLAIDPFFQYLKTNRLARQIYLKKNDRLTVQKIIDIALRQDIGPDPSYSRTRNIGEIKSTGRADLMNDLQQKQRQSFNFSSYYGNASTNVNTLYDQLIQKQPIRHFYTPISRYQKIKKYQRKLKKYDIHWRNVELLRQFLTPYGNLKTRWANRLSKQNQKKVKTAIKAARHNCAIPFYGRILSANKRNITNIQDEVKQIGLQNVNLQTGQIFYAKPRSMDSVQLEKQKKLDTDYQYQQMIKGNNYQLWVDTPDPQKKQDQQLLNAYHYLRQIKVQQQKKRKQKLATEGSKQDKLKLHMKKLRKTTLKAMTMAQMQQQNMIQIRTLTPEQKKKFQQTFHHLKQIKQKQFLNNPLSAIKVILQEKTKVY